MAINNFIPNLWTASFLKNFAAESVFASVCNRDYEGTIKNAGDTVTILELDEPTITAYTGAAITPEAMTGATQALVIDQQYYAAFKVTDVEKAQAAANPMAEYTRKAARGLAKTIDTQIAGLYAQAGSSVSTTSAPLATKSTNILEAIGDCAEALNEKNIPQSGRWMVIPPWFFAKLQICKVNKDTNNSDIISNGYVGRFLGFDLYVSTNVSCATTYVNSKIMCGTRDAISLALQVKETEAYRIEADFADAVKILWLWGKKVVNPNALVTFYSSYAAE
jgi:hypothetical protein